MKKRDVRREQRLAASGASGMEVRQLADRFAAVLTSPSQALARGKTHAQLRDAISRLDPLDREIILLRHIEELSNREAADELGLTPAAASKRYLRALQRIRRVSGTLTSGAGR